MKKNIIYISIILFFAIAVVLINRSKKEAAKAPSDSNFAVADIHAIERIVITGTTGVADIRREADHWKINGKYRVMPPKIDVLLETIQKISVYAPVAQNRKEAVMREIEAGATKVEIYHKGQDKPFKSYYVGGATEDSKGTYMLMEIDGIKADKPYVLSIPGFTGIVNVRFFTDEEDWRDTNIFSYSLEDIRQVTVQYPEFPDRSFYINKVSADSFTVQPVGSVSASVSARVNKESVVKYLSSFRQLNAESFENDFMLKDSVLNATPFVTLSVTDKTSKTKQLAVYYMPLNRRSKHQYDERGNELPYDLDRYYASVNGGKDFVLIQDFVFGKIFRSYADFLGRQSPS